LVFFYDSAILTSEIILILYTMMSEVGGGYHKEAPIRKSRKKVEKTDSVNIDHLKNEPVGEVIFDAQKRESQQTNSNEQTPETPHQLLQKTQLEILPKIIKYYEGSQLDYMPVEVMQDLSLTKAGENTIEELARIVKLEHDRVEKALIAYTVPDDIQSIRASDNNILKKLIVQRETLTYLEETLSHYFDQKLPELPYITISDLVIPTAGEDKNIVANKILHADPPSYRDETLSSISNSSPKKKSLLQKLKNLFK
jgi:hypothetical protein